MTKMAICANETIMLKREADQTPDADDGPLRYQKPDISRPLGIMLRITLPARITTLVRTTCGGLMK